MESTLAEPNEAMRAARERGVETERKVERGGGRLDEARSAQESGSALGEIQPVLDHLKGIVASFKRLATIAVLRKKVKVKRIGVLAGFGFVAVLALFFLIFSSIVITMVGMAGVASTVLDAPIWAGLAIIGSATLLSLGLGALIVWKKLAAQRLAEIRRSLGASA